MHWCLSGLQTFANLWELLKILVSLIDPIMQIYISTAFYVVIKSANPCNQSRCCRPIRTQEHSKWYSLVSETTTTCEVHHLWIQPQWFLLIFSIIQRRQNKNFGFWFTPFRNNIYNCSYESTKTKHSINDYQLFVIDKDQPMIHPQVNHQSTIYWLSFTINWLSSTISQPALSIYPPPLTTIHRHYQMVPRTTNDHYQTVLMISIYHY